MKRIIVNIMSTTGITLIILALIGTFHGAKFLCIDTVFQTFVANMVVHLGLILLNKIESKYIFLESLLDISYTIGILLGFGYAFDWYPYTPAWLLVVIAIVVYLIGFTTNIFRMQKDVKIVNELLMSRNRRVL